MVLRRRYKMRCLDTPFLLHIIDTVRRNMVL